MRRDDTMQKEILNLVADGRLAPRDAARLLRGQSSTEPGKSTRDSEIAIVGVAGRFPDASDVDAFWENLVQGKDSVRGVPLGRWPNEEATNGGDYCRRGGFLDSIEQFDPLFFDISPREAELMDPQQRLFLEEVCHAFENGGFSQDQLHRSRCGVFVGATPGDYKLMLREARHEAEAFTLVGTDEAILAARISYLLNLKGPSLSVNTACSSSLVALTLACESLVAGNCDLAVAGGVSVYSTPDFHVSASRAGILSPTGRCKAFDDSADGFVPGEAVGVVVLKRLADAVKDGDIVHGVISAWGSNQDGRSNGITAPNAVSQTELIRETYQKFGIDPKSVGYVETHGTGTKLGDPIEVAALTDAFGLGDEAAGSCVLGSVKSNVGHTFAAAGMTGLIKVLACLKHRTLVPSLHFDCPNRHIDFAASPFRVCQESQPWPVPNGQARHAALSSFGFSGTNVHLVVREYESIHSEAVSGSVVPRLFPLSAKSSEALRSRRADMIAWLNDSPNCSLKDLSYTLCCRWTHYEERWAVVASSRDELVTKLATGDPQVTGNAGSNGLSDKGPSVATVVGGNRIGSKGDYEHVIAEYLAGRSVPFADLVDQGRVLSLPGYPFQRERCWYDAPQTLNVDEGFASRPTLKSTVHSFTEMIGALEDYARHRLVYCLTEMGMSRDVETSWDQTSLARSMGVDGGYERLFEALLTLLVRADYLERTGSEFRTCLKSIEALKTKPVSDAALVQSYPDAQRYLPLLSACLEGLADILTGRIRVTQVMFPEGSMRLVGPTYQGDPIRDYFNAELAGRVVDALIERGAGGRSMTVLEVGAGTGGTSAEVLRCLRERGVNEGVKYIYSDVSPTFMTHGERTFGKGAEFMSFRVLDVERSLGEQGIGAGEVDIIFASNVLHAVRDVGSALGNLAEGLKPGGLLLLNEITATNDLTTLTFGLTPGWWRFNDPSKRVADSPLLSPESWQRELRGAGFAFTEEARLPFSESIFEQRLIVAEATEARKEASNQAFAAPKSPVTRLESVASEAESLDEAALRFIRERLGRTVKLDPTRIQADKTFEVYGVDSLVVVELTTTLEKDFGSLPSTLLFEYQTPRRLADYFVREHRPRLQELVLPKGAEAAESLAGAEATKRPTRRGGAATEDIAIIGLAGRYPGSPDLAAFWENLSEGRNCIREIPSERWSWEDSFDAKGGQGKSYSRWGGFLDDVDRFDPLFFNIAPREVAGIDPQERLFLETVWHALEDAGHTPDSLRDEGRVGVFAGVMNSDYSQVAMDHKDPSGAVRNRTAFWSLANRVSYVFDFQGPSFAVDSACSSSLTAIHLACQSLRVGDSSVAIAGGVNLILHPSKYSELSRLGMLSSDDRCKAFGADADGFVDGEGVGAVLLRPLSDALAAGDHIYGVVKGSSINAGGKTSGYTVPNPNAQADLLERALDDARLTAEDISYVEAHGTGTSLGDPIELAALTNAYRRFGNKETYCAIGSVKSNIGHLESAAGIAGLTKVLLQLRHQELAPTIHCDELNPKMALAASPFYVNRERRPWLAAGETLRAGISSFGAGGANAHVIVEKAPDVVRSANVSHEARLVLLSARNEDDLKRVVRRYREFVDGMREEELDDLCFTLQAGRVAQAYTLALVVHSVNELKADLTDADQSLDVQTCLRPSAAEKLETRSVPQSDLLVKAQQWVDGERIDWGELYPQSPRRMGLPVYPFAGKRFWVGTARSQEATTTVAKITSVPEMPPAGREFRISPEDALVKHHRVAGQPIMPGIGYVTAIMLGNGTGDDVISLSKLFWVSPLVVSSATRIALELGTSDNPTEFAFRSESGQLLSRGCFEIGANIDVAPLGVLERCRKRQGRRFGRPEIDRLFSGVGIEYGSYFRTLLEAETFDDSMVVGRLEAMAELTSEWENERIHPALLDGALQVIGCLMAGDGQPMLPYSVGTLVLFAGIANAVSVEAVRTGRTSFDLDLRDEAGDLCASVRDFVVREMGDPISELLYVPRWEPVARSEMNEITKQMPESEAGRLLLVAAANDPRCVQLSPDELSAGSGQLPLPEAGFETDDQIIQGLRDCQGDGEPFGRVVFLASDTHEDTPAGLLAAERQGVLSLLRFLRVLREVDTVSRAARIFLVTEGVSAVFDDEPVQPWAGSMKGLGQSAAKEMSSLSWHFVDLCPRVAEAEIEKPDGPGWLDQVLACPDGWEISVRGGKYFRQSLYPLSLPRGSVDGFRSQGVYLIAGGGGGIGFEFSKYLAKAHGARLIWLGRSQQSRHEERMQTIRSLGGEVAYIRCDIADRDAVMAAVVTAQTRFGALHGVFHSAIVLRDQSLMRMDEATLRETLSVKASGSQNLFHAVRELPLDFFVFFSSAQSFVSNPGQGSYAAACVFKDAYARFMRQQASFPVKIVNWGYWGDVGIVANETTKKRMADLGVQSVEPQEGIEVVKRLLASEVVQVLPVRMNAAAERGMGIDPTRRVRSSGTMVSPVVEVQAELDIQPERALGEFQEAYERLQILGRLKLLNRFRELGVFEHEARSYTPSELRARLKVAPDREPLFLACLEMLSRVNLILDVDNAYCVTPRVNNGLLGELVNVDSDLASLARDCPSIRSFVELLSRCLAEFTDVLSGRKAATDVLFPGGTTQAVEGIYHANPLAGWCNRLCARVVEDVLGQLSARTSGEPLRLLEIGAGTGGTSKVLTEAIQVNGYKVEYNYTDLSPLFLKVGNDLAEKYPFVRTSTLDIASERESRRWSGAVDIVVAANVLHAAEDLRSALRHAKRLLKRGGLLLLNELTRRQDYTTLTFGLLDGWWPKDDLRVAHSPLLDRQRWETLCREEGFYGFRVIHSAGEQLDLGQDVMVAFSDGLVCETTDCKDEFVKPVSKEVRPGHPATRRGGEVPRPASVSAEAIQGRVGETVLEIVSSVLEIDRKDLDPDVPHAEFGVDSILAIEMVEKIKTALTVDLQVTDFFNYSTIRELTSHLVSEIKRQGVVLTEDVAEHEAEQVEESDFTPQRSYPVRDEKPKGDQGVLDVFARVRTGELAPDEARALLKSLEGDGLSDSKREGGFGDVWER